MARAPKIKQVNLNTASTDTTGDFTNAITTSRSWIIMSKTTETSTLRKVMGLTRWTST